MATASAQRSRRTRRADERGQTTLDFAVGMGLFIISLTFILIFVPGLLDPFTAGTQDETTAVNRVADQLSQQLLGDPSEPYVLDIHCTREFFQDDAVIDCPFSGATLEDRLGLREPANVNVTIRSDVTGSEDSHIVCWDGSVSPGQISEYDGAGPGTCTSGPFARGPHPNTAGSRTVSAQRVVSLEGHDVTIHVEMW